MSISLQNQAIREMISERNEYAQSLSDIVFAKIDEALPVLQSRYPTIDFKEIITLLHEGKSQIEKEGEEAFQKHFLNKEGRPDKSKILAFTDLYNVLHTVRTYAPVMMERTREMLDHTAQEAMDKAIFAMRDAGYTADEAEQVLLQIKDSSSDTSHPTETLDFRGIELCLNLVEAAEKIDDELRREDIENAIYKMIISKEFGATKRATNLSQIDVSHKYSRVKNKGSNRHERRVDNSFFKAYGRRLSGPLDTAPHIWEAYDADGDNTHEGWAMMAQMASTTYEMLEDAFNDLEKASRDEAGLSLQHNEHFKAVRKELRAILDRLYPTYEESRRTIEIFAHSKNPEERYAEYQKLYPRFGELEKDFSQIYALLGRPNDRGFKIYLEAIERLGKLRELSADEIGPEAALLIDETFRTLRRNGFALNKGQTRHNDIVQTKIIDNLFNLAQFRARKLLPEIVFQEIDEAGGLSKLATERQYEILEQITDHTAEDKTLKALIVEDLYAANPLKMDANGYPKQERSILDRLNLRADYPLIFDQGIISDCGVSGPTNQMFLADRFGMTKMRHMPLNEDRETLASQSNLVLLFHKCGGLKNVERRENQIEKSPEWKAYWGERQKHVLDWMRPCSDAERNGGSLTRMEAMHTFSDMVDAAFEIKKPIEVMLGCGMSSGRWGADPAILSRKFGQRLKEIAIETGKPFERDDPILEMLCVSRTVQGRARRYLSATPGQVADGLARHFVEIIYTRMDLEGVVPDYTHIQKRHQLPRAIVNCQGEIISKGINDYETMRFATNGNGSGTQAIVTNSLGTKVTCPNVIGFSNHGARPLSKTGVIITTEVRAIQNDLAKVLSQLHDGGYYGMGLRMQSLHEQIHEGSLLPEDVIALTEDPEWDFNIFNKNMADATRASYNYAVKQMGWKPSFDDLIELGSKVSFTKSPGDKNSKILHPEDTSAEQAVIAKIFYDRALFMGMTEACFSKDISLMNSEEEILNYMRPADNSLNVQPGPATQERYPVAMAIAEEHKEAWPALAIAHLLEEHLTKRMDAGQSKEDAVRDMGGEAYFRKALSAQRAVIPHWLYWSNEFTILKPNTEPALLKKDPAFSHDVVSRLPVAVL